MKTFIVTALGLCLAFIVQAQVPSDGPPLAWQSVCWQFDDLDDNPVSQRNSGEEWWYDFKPVFDGSDNQIGYIACGFASFKDLNNVFASGTCNNTDEPTWSGCNNGGELRTDDWYAGPTALQTISFYNLRGRMVWWKEYNPGEFHHIIQAPDKSGFVAVGISRDTKDRTQVEYDWTGTSDGFVRFNPESGQPEFTLNGQETSEPCDIFDPGETPAGQFMVTKVDNNGDVEWSYAYGYLDENAFSQNPQLLNFYNGHGYDLVGYMDGSDVRYRCVGKCKVSPNPPEEEWVMFDLDEDGMLEWRYKPGYTGKSLAMTVKHFNDGADDLFYVGGTVDDGTGWDGFVSCFTGTTTNSFEWTEFIDENWDGDISSTRKSEVWDIDFDHDDNLLIAATTDMENSSVTDGNRRGEGVGKIYTITNAKSGTISNERPKVSIGTVRTFDLKIDVEPTSDDGIAVVSSKVASPWTAEVFRNEILRDNNLIPPDFEELCTGGVDTLSVAVNWVYWNYNANAYVAKYNLDGSDWDLSWEKTIETQEPRLGFPDDLKLQECVYTIHEDFDGGLVVCGNTSHNFDDYYLFKIHGQCELEDAAFEFPDDIASSFWTQQTGQGFEDNYELGSNLTWSNNTLHIKGSLYIPNGKKLTLDNCTIQFADTRRIGIETKIVVLGGGELELKNGSLLTSNSSCPHSMWDGIIVIGNPFSTNTSHQGKVVMASSSKIEHSINAIQLGNGTFTSQEWQGGGILQADDAIFENNRRDVIFYPHGASQISANSPSHIRDSDFSCTGPLRDIHFVANGSTQRVGTNIHVSMWGVHGIEIQGNTFSGTSSLPADVWATGISSMNATYSVDCETKNASGCVSAANSFDKLSCGIRGETTSRIISSHIEGNSFSDISTTGIHLIAMNFADIINNSFTQSWGHAAYHVGEGIQDYSCSQCGIDARAIFLHDCSRYLVEGNTITASPPVMGGYIGTGIEVFNSHDGATNGVTNEVYRNEFEDLKYGSFGNRFNTGNDPTGVSGLDFRCGEYTHNLFDILAAEGPGISAKQGSYNSFNPSDGTLAGNILDDCAIDDGELYNEGNFFEYLYHNSTSGPIVQPTSGCFPSGSGSGEVGVSGITETFDAVSSCPVKLEHVSRSTVAGNSLNTKQTEYASDLAMYNSIIDAGNGGHLMSLVNSDALETTIENDFGSASPYLSDSVMLALINDKPTPLTEVLLVDILIDNSPISTAVQDAVDNRVPSISSTELDRLDSAQTGTSARDSLDVSLALSNVDVRIAKDEYIRSLIHRYDYSKRLDTIILVLGDEDDSLSMTELASAYIHDAQWSNAQDIIDDLDGSPVWGEYADHLQNMLDWASDSVELDTILRDSTLFYEVAGFADDSTSAASMQSRVMLDFLLEILPDEPAGKYRISEVSFYPETGPAKRGSQKPEEAEDDNMSQSSFIAYPNPFSDNITFEVEGLVGSEITVTDIRGVLVDRLTIQKDQRLIEWNSASLPAGVYIATLAERGTTTSLKIIKY